MKIRFFTKFLVALFTLNFGLAMWGKITLDSKKIDADTFECTLNFDLNAKDFIYKEYLDVSVDHPEVQLSNWHASKTAVSHYDPAFKDTKKIYDSSFALIFNTQGNTESLKDAHLHLSFYQHSNKKIVQETFPLNKLVQKKIPIVEQDIHIEPKTTIDAPALIQESAHKQSWSDYISDLVKQSDSVWIRMALVLILGILMSLTPCIYPMIPITAGILQSQGSSSVLQNFSRAFAYTVGIATTFSLLGLAAAFTGQMFGSMLSNPLVILFIVALLIYLGFSMIGFYDMYVPSFLQSGNTTFKGGSVVSAFMFGAISGTVASPCLSPGLVLLLSIVASIGSKFMGFLLLFCFGIGLSVPLLIIGTLSSSINQLPRAGMWMVEVKQFFGFILLGMCFYFLNNILPWHLLLWSITIFILLTGIFYLHSAQTSPPNGSKNVKNLLGMILVASFVFLTAKSYQASYIHNNSQQTTIWLVQYNDALKQATLEHKKIILDVSTPYCSICKAIDKKIFADKKVAAYLENFVPVKIDGSDTQHQVHAALLEKFSIVGAPTLIIIDSENEQELMRWASELYDYSPEEFITALKEFA